MKVVLGMTRGSGSPLGGVYTELVAAGAPVGARLRGHERCGFVCVLGTWVSHFFGDISVIDKVPRPSTCLRL